MMSPFSSQPEKNEPLTSRLTEMTHGDAALAARAGKLLGSVPRPVPLSAAALQRIEDSLLSGSSPVPTSPLRWVGLGATVAAAVTAAWFLGGRHHQIPNPVKTSELVAPVAAPAQRVVPAAPAPSAPLLGVSELEPAPAPLQLPASARTLQNERSRDSAPRVEHGHRGGVPAAPAVSPPPSLSPPPAPPVEESGLLAESRMLGQALHQLHQAHDAQSALSSLAAYEARFPHGLLGEEAQAARVDALLVLDRKNDALELLDSVTFNRLARGGELRVVRGELRAQSGRCREAVADFGWALVHQPTTSMVERALYGRAACSASLHDLSGARADLTEYLQRFPQGRFAPAAKASLAKLPQE